MISLCLSLLLFSAPQELTSLKADAPHPSYPVWVTHNLGEDDAAWNYQPWWVRLDPQWLEEEPWYAEQARSALLERVAGMQGVSEAEYQRWLEVTREDAIMLNYRILVDGSEALVGRESVPMGKSVAFHDLVSQLGILDFDVEIASGAEIFAPQMGVQFSGASLALQLLPVPGQGWDANLALVFSHRIGGEAIPMDYAQVDGKKRLIARIAEAQSQVRLTPRKPITLHLPSLGPGEITLELLADAPAPAVATALQPQLAWVALPSLARQPEWNRLLRRWEEAGTVWSNGEGDVVFMGEDALAKAQAATQLPSLTPNTIHLELKAQRLLAGVEGERSDLQIQMLEDQPFLFAQGTVRDALTGWDVEVAQIARVADPVFQNLFSGWQGRLQAHRRADGRYLLDVDLSFSVVDVSQSRSMRLAAATLGEKGYDGEVPASPAHQMKVEIPEVRQVSFVGHYLTDAEGKLVLVRSANSVLGEGGRLRLEFQLSDS